MERAFGAMLVGAAVVEAVLVEVDASGGPAVGAEVDDGQFVLAHLRFLSSQKAPSNQPSIRPAELLSLSLCARRGVDGWLSGERQVVGGGVSVMRTRRPLVELPCCAA